MIKKGVLAKSVIDGGLGRRVSEKLSGFTGPVVPVDRTLCFLSLCEGEDEADSASDVSSSSSP